MIRTKFGNTEVTGNTIELAADIFVLISVFNQMFENKEKSGDLLAEMLIFDQKGQDEVGKFVTHVDNALKRVKETK